jgi:hypothetical protein
MIVRRVAFEQPNGKSPANPGFFIVKKDAEWQKKN